MSKILEVYTDGSCLGNPGKGAFGIIMRYNNHEKETAQAYNLTTNNRMELMAVVVALEKITKFDKETIIYSDSKYVVDAINKGWLINWKNNKWRTSSNKPVKNIDLWQRFMYNYHKFENIIFKWVKGHAKNEMNNRVDKLAYNTAKNSKMYKYDKGYIISEK